MLVRAFGLYRTSFSGLSPETWLLSLIMLINRSGTMVVPFMTLYLTGDDMRRTLSEAGLVMGLFGLGSVIGAYFGGKFSDRIGFYKVQVITLFCGGIMFIVLGQIRSYPLICIFTFLLSLVNEAFRPANSTAIASYSKPENRTRSYSLNRLAINLGWALGTSVGGMLASVDYELLFWVDGFTNIGASAALLLFLKPVKSNTEKEKKETIPIQQSAYRDKPYLMFTFLITIFAICFFQLFTTIPKYFRDHLFMDESFIGYIMALNGLLIVIVEMVLVYKLEGRRSNLTFVSIGVTICAFSFFALLLPGNAVAVTLTMILLITIGEIVAMPFMASYWTLRSTETNRGQYAALYTMSWGIAQTLGPFLCALLVDFAGFDVLFVVLGAALLFAGFAFNRLDASEARSV
jgi:predicted MFS family arabinose efflux permease